MLLALVCYGCLVGANDLVSLSNGKLGYLDVLVEGVLDADRRAMLPMSEEGGSRA